MNPAGGGTIVGRPILRIRLSDLKLDGVEVTFPFTANQSLTLTHLTEPGDGYVYISCHRNWELSQQFNLARVPWANLFTLSAWEWRTDSGWSATETDAQPFRDVNGNLLNVAGNHYRLRNGLWIVSGQEFGLWGEGAIYYGPSPTGPWRLWRKVLTREQDVERHGGKTTTYFLQYHHVASDWENMVFGYSVNLNCFAPWCVGVDGVLVDASIYMPRYITVPAPAPSLVAA
jgi:hypothetical protein